jgi:lysozyme
MTRRNLKPAVTTPAEWIARETLPRHEDIKLYPYRCPAGKLTIGCGRNLEDLGISRNEAIYLLDHDIRRVRLELEKAVPAYLALSDRRQAALIDMCFNLGLSRFLQFKKMLTAVHAGNFPLAADEMLSSRWAKQVGQRAQTLAAMMREG